MSQKSRDPKNRWRNKTVGFRVSPDEWDEIERLVRLSGMSKQDYIMSRLKNKEITVTANPRVFKALKNEIVELRNILDRSYQAINELENIERIEIVVNILERLM